MKIVETKEHYDLLVDEGNDPFHDPPILQEYMSKWDGPVYLNAITAENSVVLEVGVGTGRLANELLKSGCKYFVGIDISPKSLDRVKINLNHFSNTEFLLVDIVDFERRCYFDCAYSVLTFLHIENKEQALLNIYNSLKSGGIFVLSISNDDEWYEYGDRRVKLYPLMLQEYLNLFTKVGFIIESINETDSNFATIIKGKKS